MRQSTFRCSHYIMSEFCDYCLDIKVDRTANSLLLCKHRICEACLEDSREDNTDICPFSECDYEENFCGLHRTAYVGYCVNEMVPVCGQCIGAHDGHELRGIAELDEEIKLEGKKERNEAYTVLIKLSDQLEDFHCKFDESQKMVEVIERGSVCRMRRIEEGLKLGQVVSEIPNNGLRPDLSKLELAIRVEMLKYLNDTEKYNEEQARAYMKLKEINEELEQL